ncbi:hypothetical protein MICRO11B_100033 [Micrococcus luteus]|nr:hypothetical protein MICRO11B_100033 [Micrococcus luteus]
MTVHVVGLFRWYAPDGRRFSHRALRNPRFPLPYRADLLASDDVHL